MTFIISCSSNLDETSIQSSRFQKGIKLMSSGCPMKYFPKLSIGIVIFVAAFFAAHKLGWF